MDLIPLSDAQRPDWDAFCRESSDAWFWHETGWLDYILAYRPEAKARSLSFLCREGRRVIAVVPLILERHVEDGREVRKFSCGGMYLPAPALADDLSVAQRDDLLAKIFSVVDALAARFEVVHSAFRISVLTPWQIKPTRPVGNYLLGHGFLDASITTRVLDLRLSEDALWDGARRNHRRNIETGRAALKSRVYSGAEAAGPKFDAYRAMHALASGRVTRPARTFELMREWLAAGRGCLAEVCDSSGRGVGYEVYMTHKGSSYGLSACNDPAVERVLPVRHLIEWEAMLWMRERGAEFYEIGDQYFGTLPYDFPDAKKVSISHFKYGYGGFTMPHLRAEKFHSREYWEAEQDRRRALFARDYVWPAKDASPADELLKRIEKAERPAESSDAVAIPPEVLLMAGEIVAKNPAAAGDFRAGGVNAVNFLVGQAMKTGRGLDAKVVKRAIETALAQAAP